MKQTKKKVHQENKKDDRPTWLVRLADRHGIFLLKVKEGKLDFLDKKTGKSVGIWKYRPWPQFIIKGIIRRGTAIDALKAIINSRDL